MIILGIDPGLATTGWAIIEKKDRAIKAIDYGAISTKAGLVLARRIRILFDDVNELIEKYYPEIVCIEKLFFNTNAKTAMLVGQARGVVMLAAEIANISIREYTPLQIKINTTGYGQAEKIQVQKMVKELLNLPSIPKPDDAADALAVAICGAYNTNIEP